MSNHPASLAPIHFAKRTISASHFDGANGSVSPTSLAIAVANAGGLAGRGAVVILPEAIKVWASEMRAGSNGGFQLNLWIPDPTSKRNLAAEDAVRDFLRALGAEVASEAGNFTLPDFAAQCQALLEA